VAVAICAHYRGAPSGPYEPDADVGVDGGDQRCAANRSSADAGSKFETCTTTAGICASDAVAGFGPRTLAASTPIDAALLAM
jgi:hypothetical protein